MSNSPVHLKVPRSFFEERKYLSEVIFKELLGITYTIEQCADLWDKYIIELKDKTIEIEDDFFSRTDEDMGYLFPSLIPPDVTRIKNKFLKDEDAILLFGSADINISANKIFCGPDIFASIFFMLSRWEECVLEERDYLNRFPASASLAFKFGFLHRPVVNEWIEMLKNMICYLVPEIIFQPKQCFEIVFTHDIDLLNAPVTIKEFAKDLLKRKSPNAFIKRSQYLLQKKNPYNVFDYFMDVSERNNTLSRFYFMTGHNVRGRDGESYNSTPFYKEILKHIQKRGHVIGFHPSLLSYNNPEMFAKEKRQLETDIDAAVFEGRQHALRFDLPDTWRIWEENGMHLDSTLGYSAKEGFRCGTGNTFTVFDVKTRKHLSLKEMPLIVMDTTLNVNRKLSIQESRSIINDYIETGKRYNMPVTLLFHNLIDDSIDWNGWKSLYDSLFFNSAEI